MFHFVYADEDGNGYINEDFFGLGLLGASFVEPGEEEVIPLPEGASLTMIPNRAPVVINDEDQFTLYPEEGWVMGALLPQGYTRTLLPAFVMNGKGYISVMNKAARDLFGLTENDRNFYRKYLWPNINNNLLTFGWNPKSDWERELGKELDDRGIRRMGSNGFQWFRSTNLAGSGSDACRYGR